MNREIEFRGKRLDNDEWVYGDLMHDNHGGCYIYPLDAKNLYTENKVDPDTVGQFTGLHDKNNRGIYEGDIVECVSWNEYFTNPATGEVMQPFRRKMYVDFRKGGFKIVEPMPEPMKDNEWDIICNGDIEIIGNIYDNPELIKVKKV